MSFSAPGGSHRADGDCPSFPGQAAALAFFVAHGGRASHNFDDLDDVEIRKSPAD